MPAAGKAARAAIAAAKGLEVDSPARGSTDSEGWKPSYISRHRTVHEKSGAESLPVGSSARVSTSQYFLERKENIAQEVDPGSGSVPLIPPNAGPYSSDNPELETGPVAVGGGLAAARAAAAGRNPRTRSAPPSMLGGAARRKSLIDRQKALSLDNRAHSAHVAGSQPSQDYDAEVGETLEAEEPIEDTYLLTSTSSRRQRPSSAGTPKVFERLTNVDTQSSGGRARVLSATYRDSSVLRSVRRGEQRVQQSRRDGQNQPVQGRETYTTAFGSRMTRSRSLSSERGPSTSSHGMTPCRPSSGGATRQANVTVSTSGAPGFSRTGERSAIGRSAESAAASKTPFGAALEASRASRSVAAASKLGNSSGSDALAVKNLPNDVGAQRPDEISDSESEEEESEPEDEIPEEVRRPGEAEASGHRGQTKCEDEDIARAVSDRAKAISSTLTKGVEAPKKTEVQAPCCLAKLHQECELMKQCVGFDFSRLVEDILANPPLSPPPRVSPQNYSMQ
ncbi:hypothetical protein CYMTET_41893 [Cymbomonas tetramitiformis]|uniref:Uncharacterized protein n=1 Tax=Cymbomonas tetramitiformis TaxID=36881 RepID=A0AAE0F1S6_9CHLO|nr:hypothetical protein CYMTET_41893 [Cymbomonas tetramitiformis]